MVISMYAIRLRPIRRKVVLYFGNRLRKTEATISHKAYTMKSSTSAGNVALRKKRIPLTYFEPNMM